MRSQYKVLVVDDNELLREMLGLWLTNAGYDVVFAVDGAKGLSVMEETDPDLVVTDLSMPIMDGLEFCNRIRERSDVPIIVFSGVEERDRQEECLRAGADRYLLKNTSMREFLETVKNLAVLSSGRVMVTELSY